MDPLRITFALETPVVATGFPTHLDALLAYAVTQQRLAGGDLPPDMLVRSLADDLPLDRHEQNGAWVWKASVLTPKDVGEQSVRMWTRKTNTDDYAARVTSGDIEIGVRSRNALEKGEKFAVKIDIQRGLMKNMFQFYPVVEVNEMVAWCIGDVNQIEALLAPENGLVTHLGKRSRIGHGRVRSVTIDYDETALERWKERVLPWQENASYLPIQAACHPPYWAPENRMMSFLPEHL